MSTVRPLGIFERYYTMASETGITRNVAIILTLHASTPPPRTHWVNACKLLAHRYPGLTVTVADDEFKPQWVRLTEDNARSVLDSSVVEVASEGAHDDDVFREYLETLHLAPAVRLDGSDLMWRIHLLQSKTSTQFRLVFLFHHALLDGRSASQIVTLMMVAFDDLYGASPSVEENSVTSLSVTSQSDDVLIQPLEKLLDARPGIGRLLRIATDIYLPSYLKLPSTTWLGNNIHVPVDQRVSFLRLLRFDASEYEGLYKACKLHDTTVNAALSASAVLAVSKLAALDPTYTNNTIEFNFGIAIDLRPYIANLPKVAFGDLLAAAEHHPSIARDQPIDFWALARKIRHDTLADVHETYKFVGVLSYVTGSWKGLMEGMKNKKPNGRAAVMSVSNMGMMNLAPLYGGVGVSEARVSQSRQGAGTAIMIFPVTCKASNVMVRLFVLISCLL